jgi:hypothetical protein
MENDRINSNLIEQQSKQIVVKEKRKMLDNE